MSIRDRHSSLVFICVLVTTAASAPVLMSDLYLNSDEPARPEAAATVVVTLTGYPVEPPAIDLLTFATSLYRGELLADAYEPSPVDPLENMQSIGIGSGFLSSTGSDRGSDQGSAGAAGAGGANIGRGSAIIGAQAAANSTLPAAATNPGMISNSARTAVGASGSTHGGANPPPSLALGGVSKAAAPRSLTGPATRRASGSGSNSPDRSRSATSADDPSNATAEASVGLANLGRLITEAHQGQDNLIQNSLPYTHTVTNEGLDSSRTSLANESMSGVIQPRQTSETFDAIGNTELPFDLRNPYSNSTRDVAGPALVELEQRTTDVAGQPILYTTINTFPVVSDVARASFTDATTLSEAIAPRQAEDPDPVPEPNTLALLGLGLGLVGLGFLRRK